MVGVGGWCAPKARARKDGLPKEMACRGDWGVPKAMDAPATKKSSSMGTKFLLQEKSSSMGTKFLLQEKSSSMDTKSLLREKSSNMEVRCEGVEGATAKPPPRLRRGEPPAFGKEPLWSARLAVRSRPSGATQHRWGKSGLGALLRERKVTGRDASLPAPWLATSFGAVARERVGALPQTPQGSSAP